VFQGNFASCGIGERCHQRCGQIAAAEQGWIRVEDPGMWNDEQMLTVGRAKGLGKRRGLISGDSWRS
jgi:hypothetical protein